MKGLSSQRIALKADVIGPEKKKTVCRQVPASFSRESLQAGAMKGLSVQLLPQCKCCLCRVSVICVQLLAVAVLSVQLLPPHVVVVYLLQLGSVIVQLLPHCVVSVQVLPVGFVAIQL